MSHPSRPLGPLSTASAVVLATLVHLLTLAVAALGIVLLWPGTTLFHKLLGVLCLLLAWTMRPALGDRRPSGTTVDLRRCTETAAVLRDVAAAVGSPRPTHVEVTSDPVADLRLIGLRGHVVVLSAPLWVALSGPERVALLGHELGHLRPGGVLLRRYVDGATRTLRSWEGVLAPYRPGFDVRPQDQLLITSSGGSSVQDNAGNGIIADLVTLALWPVRALIAGYRRLLEIAAAPSRGAWAARADRSAARAAGTAATVGLLEVLLAVPAVETSVQRAAAGRSDVATAIVDRMAVLDAGQRRALRNVDALTRVDEAHPPTLERLRLVESEQRVEPTVVVPAARWAAVDAELSDAVTKQLKRLADDYRYGH